jgi:two-component sensor histidine kinase/CheY-like chemotaxis protein
MTQTVRLLLVEDVEDDALLLVRELRKGGIDPDYARVETAEELKAALENGPWDAVFADYNLPAFTGLDALRIVRERSGYLPFILVSGVIGEETAVEALHAGAHDYLMKGRFGRLVSALERALRDAALQLERRQTAEELTRHREHLEEQVQKRTEELAATNEALKVSLAEKDVLLGELAHRTKNNMQVISSLIDLQAGASADPKLAGALAETRDRIRAMALVHEKLHRTRGLSSVNMRDYLTDLEKPLLRAHAVTSGSVAISLDIEELPFPIDAALYCGLIINELVSNSLKYAFPKGKPGSIFLSLHRVEEETELRYRDDGPGLPRDLNPPHVKSLGLKLVYNLAVRQLRGTIELRRDPVTEFVFRFGSFAHMEKL